MGRRLLASLTKSAGLCQALHAPQHLFDVTLACPYQAGTTHHMQCQKLVQEALICGLPENQVL